MLLSFSLTHLTLLLSRGWKGLQQKKDIEGMIIRFTILLERILTIDYG